MSKTSTSPQIGYLSLFRNNANFRRLYLARLVSLFGDWFHLLAVLALLRAIGGVSASEFGFLLIVKMLPNVFISPLAGVVADRFSRRKIMIVADIARAICVLAMFGLAWWPNVWMLYLLVALQACASAFFEPARTALLPDLVSAAELTAANALGAATWSAMLTLGTAIGGVFTAYFGWRASLAVDIGSYLLSILFLLRLQEPSWQPKRPKATDGWLARLGIIEIREGLAYIIARPRVLSLALVKSGWCLAGAITLLLTLLGERVYAIGANALIGVTVLYVSRGVGTALGPILSRWISRSEPAAMERMILAGFLCGATFYALLPFAGHLALAAIIVVCAHLGGATIWVFSTVRLQQIVPTQVRGRVFAAQQAAFTIMISLSTGIYGWLVDHKVASINTLLLCISASLLLPASLWAWRGNHYGWATDPPNS